MRWQVQEAKQRFSEMLRAVTREGPQTISRHGQDAFVVIDIDEYRRLTGRQRDLKSILLGPPYFTDEMSAIMDEIEQDRRADEPRPVDLPHAGGGHEQ
ncbi:type II toxin-antitoxin system Phd/YefM family antitoxin [Frankia sp. CNm7]|uniref:Antitoxin n=1 Tax=Frankia nepalensis TaxID=1836974 RepID=A0A937RD95_9ACTN|nr:type II toxin-antitoxin system Phd/YefM family antitoxin [Frankia nepalensis]MBL7495866.1 type II toxin-antitoxin system Phd/YefM family antitoxin [Frankia nepalensis]MBL7510407.1 type II toxin-antitoxin system Phd/YefM family antitoxin [Frankia nepalensis]MBL7524744.1 type II toxin-antitoxin system Phd/YefM family antitoxin [Frankia nepalensis]MBL7630006.1 type II toxin-antitoxin system Phd/YefM family antitoxin [Frankia nepalensis]